MDLVEKLNKVSAKVRKDRPRANNEANTGAYLVEPFLRALGYNQSNPDDVDHEVTADVRGKQKNVDYVLKKNDQEIMLVEIKTVGTDLSNYVSQLDDYFRAKEEIKFGILTDGVEYRFYSDRDGINVLDDEPFLIVDMLNFQAERGSFKSSIVLQNLALISTKRYQKQLN